MEEQLLFFIFSILIKTVASRKDRYLEIAICFTSGENGQLSMSVKFATRAEGKCCNHKN